MAISEYIQTKARAFVRARQELGLGGAFYVTLRYFWRLYKNRVSYRNWIKAQQLGPEVISQIELAVSTWEQPPTFSVLVPVYNPKPALLQKAIESVLGQIYPHWQLCLVDDASTNPQVQQVLQTYASQDDRILVRHLEQNRGISSASNTALDMATGTYIALLDHDDELAINALYENARALRQQPDIDILYSDEDKITETGKRSDPFFKPHWSPDYFHACMYTCHLGVYRTALVRQVGGFRSEFDGAQDWDLMLRLVEQTQRIYHIPKVLYHWRLTATSVTSGEAAKPWAYAAAQRALAAMVQRSAFPGYVEALPESGFYRVRRHLQGTPLVSIIIPSAGAARPRSSGSCLETCLASIVERSTYTNLELVVVDGFDLPEPVLNYVKALGVNLVRCGEPFNFSMRINWGVRHSHGDRLLLLNDDVEVQTPNWIEAMLELAQQPEIGAVGAKLMFPNGHIQHAGVVMLEGNPGHVFYDAVGSHRGYFCSTLVNRNYLGVTGACLMVRRQIFEQVGGMDESLPLNFNDVDFCLKIHQAGYRNVFTPFAQLIHHESASRQRGLQPGELETLRERWMPYLEKFGGDPYYNINLDQKNANFML
jgi:glycosyltransferase involved in cell wall biosynthesis